MNKLTLQGNHFIGYHLGQYKPFANQKHISISMGELVSIIILCLGFGCLLGIVWQAIATKAI